jgi:hypothetical protein
MLWITQDAVVNIYRALGNLVTDLGPAIGF